MHPSTAILLVKQINPLHKPISRLLNLRMQKSNGYENLLSVPYDDVSVTLAV